jgi:hypothetical protein
VIKGIRGVSMALLRDIRRFERVMTTIEEHPELVSEETDYRLSRLAQRIREFVAARTPRE